MKKILMALPLILVLTSLLSACSGSDKTTPSILNQAPPSIIRTAQTSGSGDDNDIVDFSPLQDFVSGINDQFDDATLTLFNDDAVLNEIDQVALISNFHNNGWNHIYTGDGEIKEWLKEEIGSNAQIVPVEYKFYGNYLSMDGVLYYQDQDQAMNIQIIEKSENGKIGLLIYYILKRQFS